MNKNKKKEAGKHAAKRGTVNRNYKSTVFAMLYHDKEKLLELYNAMNHSHYTNADELEIVTLDNAIYMNMKNDLAFLVDLHLNMWEHQSTFNPNMPLRDLFYVAEEYQKLIRFDTIYSSVMIKIPAPRFLVFYNGLEERPEREVLKLSAAFYTTEENPELELKVTVLNINNGKNKELMDNCRTLREYMLFVETVRRHQREKGTNLDKAVRKAVDECIEKNILADFLRKNKTEAIKVSILEFDEEVEWEKIRRAERRYGYERGRKDGEKQLLTAKVQKKLQKGKSLNEIADDLEEPVSVIERIVQELPG